MRKTPHSGHTFHIPVMGLAFTIDTPVKVARYGISSVVSIVVDELIETMRKYYCGVEGLPYEPIAADEDDSRARRITAYLDLLNTIVERQSLELRASAFEPGSEITRYYELLPEGSALKARYRRMLSAKNPSERAGIEAELRASALPGSIDVNIMTKLDKDNYKNGEKLPPEHSDAMSALRGFAMSAPNSSVVFSAGMNPRLYSYAAKLPGFRPDAGGMLKKRITLKVSDYRSAAVQSKMLAKNGLWISEFRIESGLNCGGHAFATQGLLMGPILEEFRKHRTELVETAHKAYLKGLALAGAEPPKEPHPVRITVQGGIGSHEEDLLLRTYYEVDGTGWGTPFMLVPEATCVDDEHLAKLASAGEKDVVLSSRSPLGIPFWNLEDSASERQRKARIAAGEPGAPCAMGLLKLNPEFTDPPICAASRRYISLKLKKLGTSPEYTDEQRAALTHETLERECLCVDLGGSAMRKYGIDPAATPTLCPGPNIAYFNRTYTLEEMIGHIYGRINLLKDVERPHMFIKELAIYIDYLKRELEAYRMRLSGRQPRYFREFRENLLAGIEHYRGLAEQIIEEKKSRFLADLSALKSELENMTILDEILAAEAKA